MHPDLLRHYEDELRHIQELGREFAVEFPSVAAGLGLQNSQWQDPYVERLLEGFAFLTARIQLKLNAQFPRFVNHLIDAVYPHYLAPTPSTAIVQFIPSQDEGSYEQGIVIPRQSTALWSGRGRRRSTSCEFRLASDVTLWPIELTQATYLPDAAAVAVAVGSGGRSGLRLQFKTTGGLTFDKLPLDRLPLYIAGGAAVADALCEQLLGNLSSVVVQPATASPSWKEVLPRGSVRRCGYSADEAMLPVPARSFDGYRLLHEYFTLPARFQFVSLHGLARAVRRCAGDEIEIVFLFDRQNRRLADAAIDRRNFLLFCSPIVNLFPHRADRIRLNRLETEYQVVPDRTRRMDFEVHTVLSVSGYGAGTEVLREFGPFHGLRDQIGGRGETAYFSVSRQRTLTTAKQANGAGRDRNNYVGSDVFISLVDADEAPFPNDLRELGVTTLCTNRDLPLLLADGRSTIEFEIDQGPPVQQIRCIAGPTRPRASVASGATAWRLVNHLALDRLGLHDQPDAGATALRNLLSLYSDLSEPSTAKRIEGIRKLATNPIIRRLPGNGQPVHGRGLEVALTLDERSFDGGGVFLFGSVLEEFFAKLVSLNSFTETVIHELERGEVMRWPARTGRRVLL